MPFDLVAPRVGAACAVTNNGTLVVCGGSSGTGSYYATCQNTVEIMDNETKKFTLHSIYLRRRRCCHTATAISNNEILVCGGLTPSGDSTDSTEILNLETGQTRPSVSMRIPRESHSATLLSDGTVFICGQGSAEILDLRRRTSTPVDLFDAKAPLPIHSIAARLRSGDVLFVEGGRDSLLGPQPETQIYLEDKKDFLYGTTIHKHRASFAMTSF